MNFAIIVAGGSGTRMRSKIPKQFLLLNGKPILYYSLDAFFRFDPDIRMVVALPEAHVALWKDLMERHSISIPHKVIQGGKTRFHSVLNCLNALKSADAGDLVAIHDGVRPLLSQPLLNRIFTVASREGNAVPVIPVNESMRVVGEVRSEPVDRNRFRLVQTPQVFRFQVIQKAYQQASLEDFTDDATVAEAMGEYIHLVEGDPVNLKVTHPEDLVIAGSLLVSIPFSPSRKQE